MPIACRECGVMFVVDDTDLAFYEKVSPVFNGKKEMIPPPTLCPDCRQQRRLAFRNERALYRRTCDKSGKAIITMYPQDSIYTVYERDIWFSDEWDPMSYGRDYDFSRPFFDQFAELLRDVPRMSLVQQANMGNCEYCNRASNDKNCYLIFTSNFSEDCYYCVHVTNCKNCVDCLNTHRSELCYECVDCYECYNSKWLESCTNCSDSALLKGCTGCRNCLFCTNLVQKEYCVFNKQYSKEEYETFVAQTMFNKRSVTTLLREKFQPIKESMIVRSYVGTQNENVLGNYLDHCRNVLHSYECRECEDCKYIQSIVQAKDCMDFNSWGRGTELIYETANCGYNSHSVIFCFECWESVSNMLYSNQCLWSSNLFGCNGLRRKRYCILNKQYSKEEYERLVPKIIEHMRSTSEWGEFFPIQISPFAYNETNAQDYFPRTQQEVLSMGGKWKDLETINSSNTDKLQPPDDIREAKNDVCSAAFICKATGKPYKITSQELSVYRKHDIPIPNLCFEERHRRRLMLQNPRKLWTRNCQKCSKEIQTTYAPNRTETVYCERCYLATMY